MYFYVLVSISLLYVFGLCELWFLSFCFIVPSCFPHSSFFLPSVFPVPSVFTLVFPFSFLCRPSLFLLISSTFHSYSLFLPSLFPSPSLFLPHIFLHSFVLPSSSFISLSSVLLLSLFQQRRSRNEKSEHKRQSVERQRFDTL